MTDQWITFANLDRLLDRLRERGEVYAPGKDEEGDVALIQPHRREPVLLEYRNFRLSPKALLMPRNQTLLRFKDGRAEEPAWPERETFLFGVRPCDARAIQTLDEVFVDGESPDPYYAQRRARVTVLALACRQPMSTCFCRSVGGGPGDGTGADVLAMALEEGLVLRPRTPKGEQLLASAADLTKKAPQAATEEAEAQIRAAEDQVMPVPMDEMARRLREAYESPLWEAAGRKCLGCGTCSYLCPTCYCFDITDEVRGGNGRRVRTWDCCAYRLFTLHGSGHNPRPTPRERWRQRIMHKFRYAVENHGHPFCVGCGRCIRNCPASLDLRTVLKEVGA